MFRLPPQVNEAITRLEEAGYEAYAVGGCVRDRLMGRTPKDYDAATSALPEETMRVFSGERIIGTGLKHGTVTVLLHGEPIELTTFRIDAEYSDSRHPDSVSFTRSLREDLSRRDFTVNAMAYSPRAGLTDIFGGQEDIARRCIRCVGDPDARFSEDALRILRALRFASELDFEIEPATAAALRREKELLRFVSAERIAGELLKLLCGSGVKRILLGFTDVLGVVLPELLPMQGFEQHHPEHIYDVLEHSAVAVENAPADPEMRLAALLHDAGKPAVFTMDETGKGHFFGHGAKSAEIAAETVKRLKLSAAMQEHVTLLVAQHDRQIEPTESAVKRALNRLTPELFFRVLDIKRADTLAHAPTAFGRLEVCDRLEQIAREILARQQCFSLRGLAVDGNDLISDGMAPGKALGDALQGLLEAVMDGRVENEKSALLAYRRQCAEKER